jgi:adenylate cyclase
LAQFVPNSISGIYLQATAVNNLLRHNALTEFSRRDTGMIAFAFAAIVVVAAMVLAPGTAVLAFAALTLSWTAIATLTFNAALALPLFEPLFASVLGLVSTIGFRLVVADRDKRFLRKSFALYLAPAVIERMMASNKAPALGGEMRTVTVFFSDVAGFSSLAETMRPNEVVALMNAYLSEMTDIIEEHGGFVDKYIGDAIVAVFGAPLDDVDHARNAVRAALRCRDRLDELNRTAAEFRGHTIGQRIGLNSGEALVGNIGSGRRFNYTVIGDAVNLASRLEGANKYYGTAILASEETATLAGATFLWREVDAIRVKGRLQAVKVHEPLADAERASAEQAACAKAYSEGLACWRARDFAGAVKHFACCAGSDRPSALFLERAQRATENPPGADWEAINTLDQK